MKRHFTLGILIICLFISACSGIPVESKGNQQLESTLDEYNSNTQIVDENYDELKYILSLEVEQTEDGAPLVPDSNIVIKQKMAGKLVGEDAPKSNVYVLGVNQDSGEKHASYLAIALYDTLLLRDLKTLCHNDLLYLSDIDADGLDEIILHQHLDDFGGSGQYLSRIFQLENGTICEMFNSTTTDPLNAESGTFDTGFSGELLEGKKLMIKNEKVGYQTVIDISEKYIDDFFDEQGKGPSYLRCNCDNFFEFEPKDVDGDGVAELLGKQSIFLFNHADGLGYVSTVLKYNVQTQCFSVINAEFIAK